MSSRLEVVILLVALFSHAGQALAAPAPRTTPTKRPAAPTASELWGTIGLGVALSGGFDGGIGGLVGIYGSRGNTLFGLRQSGFDNVCYGDGCAEQWARSRETALVAGRYLDAKRLWWVAGGIARMSSVGEHHSDGRLVRAGLPLEIVFTPHTSTIGLEARLMGNITDRYSFVMLAGAFRFGSLHR
jgi:hypothetical protein